jgi:hypothetical protein
MPIIIRIRKFLKLENKTASINTDFADSVGLYLTEGMIRKIENTPSMDCLINHANAINVHHGILQNSNSFDSVHASHDLHF